MARRRGHHALPRTRMGRLRGAERVECRRARRGLFGATPDVLRQRLLSSRRQRLGRFPRRAGRSRPGHVRLPGCVPAASRVPASRRGCARCRIDGRSRRRPEHVGGARLVRIGDGEQPHGPPAPCDDGDADRRAHRRGPPRVCLRSPRRPCRHQPDRVRRAARAGALDRCGRTLARAPPRRAAVGGHRRVDLGCGLSLAVGHVPNADPQLCAGPGQDGSGARQRRRARSCLRRDRGRGPGLACGPMADDRRNGSWRCRCADRFTGGEIGQRLGYRRAADDDHDRARRRHHRGRDHGSQRGWATRGVDRDPRHRLDTCGTAGTPWTSPSRPQPNRRPELDPAVGRCRRADDRHPQRDADRASARSAGRRGTGRLRHRTRTRRD